MFGGPDLNTGPHGPELHACHRGDDPLDDSFWDNDTWFRHPGPRNARR